jgi:hypothetical protein
MRREQKWSEMGNKMIKKIWIAYEICEPNLKWNSDNRQNRKIINSLLKWDFLRYNSPKFSENFEIKSLLGMF